MFCLARECVVVRQENILALKWPALEVPEARPCVPAGRRIYAIGDIHGRSDLLSKLFTHIDDDLRARPIADSIQVFLGDYIDRGPNSRRVIDLLITRQRRRDVLFLKGNHEDCALRFLNDPTVLPAWQSIGGLPTLLSYGVMPTRGDDAKSQQKVSTALREAMPDNHRRFIGGLALSFTCGDFFFVHAGVRPGIPLQMQSQRDLLWIRDDFLLHEEDFGMVVVHGHTPLYKPDIRSNRINIDTGAYATGQLTCLVLEGDSIAFL